MEFQSPEERKAALLRRDWEIPEQRKIIPSDLQEAISAPTDVLRMGHHAWQFVQPPKPDAALAQNGIDAIKGQGKHFSARPFVDDLDRLFGEWEAAGVADPRKTPVSEHRWQVITPGPPSGWLRVVIAEVIGSGEHYIYTVYPITDDHAQVLLQKEFVRRREEK